MHESILSTPIKVKRPKRIGRKILILLLAVVLLAALLLVARVFLMAYPAVPLQAQNPQDGWRLLRGMLQVNLAEVGDEKEARQIISDAFSAKLDFLVMAQPGGSSLEEKVGDAPMAVIWAQTIQSASGGFLALAADREFGRGELQAGALFDRVRRQNGWSMVVRADDPMTPWTGWDDLVPDAFEILNARDQIADLPPLDQLAHWVGRILGVPAGWDYLGRRPKGNLAHWDDYSRKGPVLGFCGVDTQFAGYRAPMTYLYVQDGLGPYGASEVERALRAGHHFCALDIFASPSGFRFLAMPKGGGPVLGIMGDKVHLGQGVDLLATLNLQGEPENVVLVLYQDGQEVARQRGVRLYHKVTQSGSYRVEALVETTGFALEQVERVFLYSNPIFIMEGA